MKIFGFVLAVLCLASVAAGQQPATQPADGKPRGQTAPILSVPDLARGAIDPYDATGERSRFYKAAGVDSELTVDEFAADARRDAGFVRKFENWQALLAFDKDDNGKIGWFEAEAYRLDLRKKLLKQFDKNHDGSLTGSEREPANRWLLKSGADSAATTRPAGDRGRWQAGRGGNSDGGAISRTVTPSGTVVTIGRGSGMSGNVIVSGGRGSRGVTVWSGWPKPDWEATNKQLAAVKQQYDANEDGTLSKEELDEAGKAIRDAYMKIYRERLERFDGDKDGKLSSEESQAMMDAYREVGKQGNAIAMARMYDKNGDGQIDQDEQAEQAKRQAEAQKRAEEWRRKWVEKYDTDGDGEVSNEERKAAWDDMRRQQRVKQYDKDGDGKLSQEEEEEADREIKRQRNLYGELRKRWYSPKDTDGDGEISQEERQSAWQQAREDGQKHHEARNKEFDADGDGRADMEELKAAADKLRKRYDADGDGRLSAEETAEMWRKEVGDADDPIIQHLRPGTVPLFTSNGQVTVMGESSRRPMAIPLRKQKDENTDGQGGSI